MQTNEISLGRSNRSASAVIFRFSLSSPARWKGSDVVFQQRTDEFERISEFMRTYLLLRLYRLTLLLGTSGAIVTALASDSIRQRGAIVILLLKIRAIVVSGTFTIMDFSAAGHWARFLIGANELAIQLNYERFPTPSRWSPFTATGSGSYLHVLIVLLWIASLFIRPDA